jgi:hypothetical protein
MPGGAAGAGDGPSAAVTLELSVVKALLKNSLGADLKAKPETLRLIAEYLRLVTGELVERSIAAAKEGSERFAVDALLNRDPDATDELRVEASHVQTVALHLLMDV